MPCAAVTDPLTLSYAATSKLLSKQSVRDTNLNVLRNQFKTYNFFFKHRFNPVECGKFLALDLGGTNFRVLLIELGPHIFHMVCSLFTINNNFNILRDALYIFNRSCLNAGVENLCRSPECYARSWNRGI